MNFMAMEEKMRRKNQEGAIVIEATIALTTFMFLIVTILSIVNICLVQAKIGTLVHGIAKDISNYTYIYTMTGLNEKEQAISGKADYARNTIDTVTDSSTDTFDAIETLTSAALDKEFWSSMLNLVAEGGIQEVKGIAIDKVCKMAAEKRLSNGGADADSYLMKLGIEDGIEGLDFTDSVFCAGGGDDIKIIVSYKVHLLELLGVDFDFNFEQCAYTKTWCARTGSGESEEIAEKSDEDKTESENVPKNNKTLEECLEDGIHNPDSPQVMLGQSTLNADTDYESLAKLYDMTYFKLTDEDLKALEEEESDAVWEAHKKFLEEQEFAGKQFILSSNPYHATGIYQQEIEWLLSRGYTFEYDPGIGLWKAVR